MDSTKIVQAERKSKLACGFSEAPPIFKQQSKSEDSALPSKIPNLNEREHKKNLKILWFLLTLQKIHL